MGRKVYDRQFKMAAVQLVLEENLFVKEVAKYVEDSANIMINNGWLEGPPLSEDRDKLANT
mgnify:CR=1 FL=1